MSDSDSDSPTSLRTLFARAQTLSQTLPTLAPNSPAHQTTLTSTLHLYQSCLTAISTLSLFSPNETLEDLSTSSLPYLSVSHHIGNLLQRDQSTDRKAAITAAQSAYEDFLQLLSQYGLLSDVDRKTYVRFREDRNSFGVVSVADPAKRRDAKIARLREEKGLKARLEGLRADPTVLSGDEEALRSLRLAELTLQAHETFQALDFIAQELQILALAPANPVPPADPRQLAADDRVRSTGQSTGNDGYSERLDSNLRDLQRNGRAGPILDARGRPLQPFVLMDQRRDLREGVFRPGHRLPTMSIDEYLEEERRRGGIIEGGGEPPVVEPDEDDLEKADAETMKKREWDEFVESNPKGSGNTINRG